MGKIQHHILTLCLVFASMLASLSACSDSDVPGGGQAGGGDTFSLALDVTIPVMPGSRATYEQGVGDYENTIDLAAKDYRILLFSGDDKLLVEFKNDDVVLTENTPLASNPTYRSYRVTAEVDKSITEYTALKLVVLANWGDYPTLAVGATTIDDLAGYAVSNGAVSTAASTTFNGADHLQNTQGNHIPMFGVKDCQGIAWLKNDLTWFGNLWLLRAVAKIEVVAAEDSPAIESVSLSRYNSIGTCAPMRVYKESDYVTNGSDYQAFDYLTLPNGKNDPKGPYQLQRDENGAFVVYVPEYQILANAKEPQGEKVSDYACLEVKFEGYSTIYQVDFKYYTQAIAEDNDAEVGDFFDIKRNFYYKYTLSCKNADPVITVDVLPYRAVELKPDFGLPLQSLSLSKYVVQLYSDEEQETASTDVVVAYDEKGQQLSADKIKWSLATATNNVCTIEVMADGSCKIKPNINSRGRDVLIATIIDSKGIEITAESVIEVSDRHLGLDKTFLGLTPLDANESSSRGSLIASMISETDEQGTLSWKLLNEDNTTPTDIDDIEVSVSVNGSKIENGGIIGNNNTAEISIQAGNSTGTFHLWMYYDAPAPNGGQGRVVYSTYCEVVVQDISLSCYPKAVSVIEGQSTSVTTTIIPKFSNFIPTVKYRSLDPSKVNVDENGLITGVSVTDAGKPVQIEVYNDTDFPMKISDIVYVTVKSNDLVLDCNYIELVKGESFQINALSSDKNVNANVQWTIEEGDKYCSVSKGKVTATKAGSNTVIATYTVGETTLTARCVVVCADARKLIIDSHPYLLYVGSEVELKAHVFPAPLDQSEPVITWKSSNTDIIAFDEEENSKAIIKTPGTVTLTATAKYGNETQTATTQVEVRESGDKEINGFHLYIYNNKGEFVKEIFTDNSTQYDNSVDVVNNNYYDNINIPYGEKWTAEVVFTPMISISNGAWSKYQRFGYHGDRLALTPSQDGTKCVIEAIFKDDENRPNRYNEVIFSVTVGEDIYSRRFCVYSYTE